MLVFVSSENLLLKLRNMYKVFFFYIYIYNQLHKIFNRNTVKVSYSCTPNVGSIIKSHNKKLTNAEKQQTKHCNCRKKQECQLEGKCRSEDIIYKCVVTATGHPRKVYLGTAEGNLGSKKSKEQVENAVLYNSVLNKIMATCE